MVIDNMKELVDYLADKPHTCLFTVQKYIERPFLIEGNRKCQFKLWVLLKRNSIYVYKDGYAKLYE